VKSGQFRQILRTLSAYLLDASRELAFFCLRSLPGYGFAAFTEPITPSRSGCIKNAAISGQAQLPVYDIVAGDGILRVNCYVEQSIFPPPEWVPGNRTWAWETTYEPSFPLTGSGIGHRLGFAAGFHDMPGEQFWTFATPIWFPAAFFALAAFYYIPRRIRNRRRRERITLGLCPECGYDLRFAADKCPECGSTAGPLARQGVLLAE
jgi:hypothetical protein